MAEKAIGALTALSLLAVGSCAAAGPTDPKLEAVLEAHNEAREKKGVPALEWSAELAAGAGEWVAELAADSGCRASHSGTRHGENLYQCLGDCKANKRLFRGAVERWAGEEAWHDDATGECAAPAGSSCGHYRQVVWCTTERLGCGWARCGSGIILVCHYDPPGNYVGRSPFDCSSGP